MTRSDDFLVDPSCFCQIPPESDDFSQEFPELQARVGLRVSLELSDIPVYTLLYTFPCFYGIPQEGTFFWENVSYDVRTCKN